MRRILEYYFNIIGGLDYEKSINEFDGEEKIIFKSLFSWINDGSHFINDA
jgi:wobble nucleotide-excising tRNase